MLLTPELKKAISAACLAAGSQNLLAQQTGVPRQNISRYVAGTVSSITPQNLIKLWPLVSDYLSAEQRAKIGKSILVDEIANHGKEDFERKYIVLQMMIKGIYDIGADELFMQVLMYWPGMSPEQKRKAYLEIRQIAEETQE